MTRALPLAALLLSGACDPRAFVLDTGIVPGAREEAVAACCGCLAEATPPRLGEGARCPDGDGGGASERCLCSPETAGACEERLHSGGAITLVGACTTPEAPCEEVCRDVLAFPDEG